MPGHSLRLRRLNAMAIQCPGRAHGGPVQLDFDLLYLVHPMGQRGKAWVTHMAAHAGLSPPPSIDARATHAIGRGHRRAATAIVLLDRLLHGFQTTTTDRTHRKLWYNKSTSNRAAQMTHLTRKELSASLLRDIRSLMAIHKIIGLRTLTPKHSWS